MGIIPLSGQGFGEGRQPADPVFSLWDNPRLSTFPDFITGDITVLTLSATGHRVTEEPVIRRLSRQASIPFTKNPGAGNYPVIKNDWVGYFGQKKNATSITPIAGPRAGIQLIFPSMR
jgi:hypothetical protein